MSGEPRHPAGDGRTGSSGAVPAVRGRVRDGLRRAQHRRRPGPVHRRAAHVAAAPSGFCWPCTTAPRSSSNRSSGRWPTGSAPGPCCSAGSRRSRPPPRCSSSSGTRPCWCVVRFGQGAAASAFSPAAGAMVARLSAGNRHGRVFGSYGAFKSLGYALGPILGGRADHHRRLPGAVHRPHGARRGGHRLGRAGRPDAAALAAPPANRPRPGPPARLGGLPAPHDDVGVRDRRVGGRCRVLPRPGDRRRARPDRDGRGGVAAVGDGGGGAAVGRTGPRRRSPQRPTSAWPPGSDWPPRACSPPRC